jgi:diaminopimelate epimerase
MNILFFKYQGTGNDFVLLDNRTGVYNQLTQDQIAFLCHRRYGIGADGLMLLQEKDGYDFEMIYFNADGAPGSMCGNGGRCIVLFAHHLGIVNEKVYFLASDGPHEAKISDDETIELKMKDVSTITKENDVTILDTGSPHYIKVVSDLPSFDMDKEGKYIRYSTAFAEKGINVNFIEKHEDSIAIRTYERGVETETYSCGTGATAAAISVAKNITGTQQVPVKTVGGMLTIKFERKGEYLFENIWLCGPAKQVFKGNIEL